MTPSTVLAHFLAHNLTSPHYPYLEGLLAQFPAGTFDPAQDEEGEPWIHQRIARDRLQGDQLGWLVKRFGPDFLQVRNRTGQGLVEVAMRQMAAELSQRRGKDYLGANVSTVLGLLKHSPVTALAHPDDDGLAPGTAWLAQVLRWEGFKADEGVAEALIGRGANVMAPYRGQPLVLALTTERQCKAAVDTGVNLQRTGDNPMMPTQSLGELLAQRFPRAMADWTARQTHAVPPAHVAFFAKFPTIANKFSMLHHLHTQPEWLTLADAHGVPALWRAFQQTPALIGEFMRKPDPRILAQLGAPDPWGRPARYHLASLDGLTHFTPAYHAFLTEQMPALAINGQGDGILAQLWHEDLGEVTYHRSALAKVVPLLARDFTAWWGTPDAQVRLAERVVRTVAQDIARRPALTAKGSFTPGQGWHEWINALANPWVGVSLEGCQPALVGALWLALKAANALMRPSQAGYAGKPAWRIDDRLARTLPLPENDPAIGVIGTWLETQMPRKLDLKEEALATWLAQWRQERLRLVPDAATPRRRRFRA